MPPRLAPIQVVVLVVRDDDGVGRARPRALADELRGRRRARRSSTTAPTCRFGRRATDWELKGVPVRLEVGPRDLAEGEVTLVRRDTGDEGAGRRSTAVGGRGRRRCSTPIQADAARPRPPTRRDARTVDVATLDEARRGRPDGLRPHPVVGARRARARPTLAESARHRPLPAAARRLACPTSDDEPDLVAVVARAY